MVKVSVKGTDQEKEKRRETGDGLREEMQSPLKDPEGKVDSKGPGEEVPVEKMTKAQLTEKNRQAQESADRNLDLYIRSQAEMENMKKRFQREKADWVKFSNESLIKELLPVMDNLEKAIAHAKNDDSLEALSEGVELTLKGLRDTLERAGLEEVRAIGESFDPNFHEAVYEKVDNDVKTGTVLEEFQKGYTLNERLIRPAIVVISKNGPEAEAEAQN